MPDWQKLVSQRLGGLALDAYEEEEVHAEFAAHLEETYESLLREGLPESSAIHRALSLAGDWQDSRRRIQTARTKGEHRERSCQATLASRICNILVFDESSFAEREFRSQAWALVKVGQLPMVLFFIPWLLSLPLVGALGAYLSYRAGGSQRTIFSSILFPVLPFLGSILLVLPVSLIFDRFIGHNTALISLVMALLGWVLAPGVALLAGGLVAQFFLSRHSISRRTTAS
jgi:hypothetical protein